MVVAPEFARGELDGVAMLRVRASAVRVRIGKDEDTPIVADDAMAAAGIAREPRVAFGIDIARADAIARSKARLESWVQTQLVGAVLWRTSRLLLTRAA